MELKDITKEAATISADASFMTTPLAPASTALSCIDSSRTPVRTRMRALVLAVSFGWSVYYKEDKAAILSVLRDEGTKGSATMPSGFSGIRGWTESDTSTRLA